MPPPETRSTPTWCKVVAAVAAVALLGAAASGLWGWEQHRRAEERDRQAKAAQRAAQAESARADSLWRRLARTDSAEEALRDSIGELLEAIDRRLPGIHEEYAEAGADLRATIDSVRLVLPDTAEHLADSLQAQVARKDDAHERFREQMEQKVRLLVQDTLSLRRQLDSTRVWGEGERRAKEAWRAAWGRMEGARDAWRDAARKSPLEALFGESIWQVGVTVASGVAAVQAGGLAPAGWALAKGGDVAVVMLTEPRPAAVDTMELEPPGPTDEER